MKENERKQRYRFADVFIRWNDDSIDTPPQRRRIALKSREELLADEQTGAQPVKWKESGEEDNEIFYYCNCYEEFLNLIAYGYNTQDFEIIGILMLIE